MAYLFTAVVMATVGLAGAAAQTIKHAEIRPVAGTDKDAPPRFSVLLSVSGADDIGAVQIEFFSEQGGKVLLELETVEEEDRRFIISSGARFTLDGDHVMFIVQPPKSYRPAMRQARITLSGRSGIRSNTITAQW